MLIAQIVVVGVKSSLAQATELTIYLEHGLGMLGCGFVAVGLRLLPLFVCSLGRLPHGPLALGGRLCRGGCLG